jgi:hypothetical protein
METGFLLQVASTFTCTPIEPSLRAAIADANIADGLGFVQYGQISEYMLGPAPESTHILGTILMVRIEDWLRDRLKSSASPIERGDLRPELGRRADEFIKHLEVLSRRGKQVWFLACPSTGWISEHHQIDVVCQMYTNLLAARVRALRNITILNWPESLSKSQFSDRGADRLGQIPFTQEAFDRLGALLGEQIARTWKQETRTVLGQTDSSEALAEYLKNLRVHVTLAPALPEDRAHVDRLLRTVASITLTGEQRDLDDAQLDTLSSTRECVLASVSDRLAQYGFTGVVAYRVEKHDMIVDSMSVSCAVLGKQVEYAIIAALSQIAAEQGLTKLVFEYRPAGRNQATETFLKSFAEAAPGMRFVVPVVEADDRIRKASVAPGTWTLDFGACGM